MLRVELIDSGGKIMNQNFQVFVFKNSALNAKFAANCFEMSFYFINVH